MIIKFFFPFLTNGFVTNVDYLHLTQVINNWIYVSNCDLEIYYVLVSVMVLTEPVLGTLGVSTPIDCITGLLQVIKVL